MPPRKSSKGRQEGKRGERRRPQEQEGHIWVWPLPKEVGEALGGSTCEKNPEALLQKVSNPALLLQRYIPYPKKGKKGQRLDEVFQTGATEWRWELNRGSLKNAAWQGVEKALHTIYRSSADYDPAKWLENLRLRLQATIEALKSSGYTCCPPMLARVEWRLVVGLGLPSPLETGITLHHLYGFPYLPGSAIKGVTRSWRLQEIANELGIPCLSAQHINEWKDKRGKNFGATPWERLEQLLTSPVPDNPDGDEQQRRLERNLENRRKHLQEALEGNRLRALKDWGYLNEDPQLPDLEQLKQKYIRDFSRAFGSTDAKGEILFFDAYPEALMVDDKPILELDVMNPHYGDYYMGKGDPHNNPIPPADWLSPVPVFFLAVRQGTLFTIRLAGRDQNLLGTVVEWVEKALQELGIGAKTRAGYGELKTDLAPQRPQEVAPALGEKEAQAPSVLALAIEQWTTRDMGRLAKLISDLIAHPNRQERHTLAVKLQRKLLAAGRWGGKYQEKPWHRQLEELLGSKEEGRES